MASVFRFRPNQPITWYSKDPVNSNRHCLYCGVLVGSGSTVRSNKEHLIARRFVPPGMLRSTDFNFIFRACAECNLRKADAERHVSTVTILLSPARAQNRAIDAAALHKAGRDYHPGVRGALVKDSSPNWNLRARFAGGEFVFGMVGPPQLDRFSVELLARNQIQALFALVTSADPRSSEGTRLLPASQLHMLGSFSWTDWGNRQLTAVTQRVAAWPLIANIETASGHLKFLIRESERSGGEWFWALEWNRSVRVVGAVYEVNSTPPVFKDLPELKWIRLSDGHRARPEVPIAAEDDTLFRFEEANDSGVND